jgi:hypothetical protein
MQGQNKNLTLHHYRGKKKNGTQKDKLERVSGNKRVISEDGGNSTSHIHAAVNYSGDQSDGYHYAKQHGGCSAIGFFLGRTVYQFVPDLLHGNWYGSQRDDCPILGNAG